MTNLKIAKKVQPYFLLGCLAISPLAQASTFTIVGNGAGGGPIFLSSTFANIDIGTRVRIGVFSDLTLLNSTIAAFTNTNNPTSYADTLSALNSNFIDLGTGVTNFGSSSQTANGGASFSPSTSQFGFNNLTSLTVNGVSGTYNTFNGSLSNVNSSLAVGVGTGKNLYIWTAFNSEIAIVRNADGTGTGAWVTPSDAANVTLNLSGLQATAGGTMQSSEVLLGKIVEYSSGPDLILLIPEPSSSSLLVLAALSLLRFRGKLGIKNKGNS